MRRLGLLALIIIVIAISAASGLVANQSENFIRVEGADLQAKIAAATRLARARQPATRFWTAYSFDVRPGVAVDAEVQNFRGTTNVYSGTSVSIGSSGGMTVETRNLGVFQLREADGNAIVRIEIYNLDRQREYSGYPVYWMGRAGNEESLRLLRGLAESDAANRVSEHATLAIALHDDPRVAGILKDFVRTAASQLQKTRSTAVFWLGQIGGEGPFLAELVRRDDESTEIRKRAAFAVGASKDKEALATLRSLYDAVTNRDVRKQIIFAASINEDKDAAVEFLVKVASTDTDRDLKKQALFWLGQKAGQRSLAVLGDAVNDRDADTEVQKQAVFAISQRPRDEAVPLLIKVARTHEKPAVRKQAMFWLGQTGDERAIEFFKEVLAK